ncbi:MAG: hypothetical protein QGI60_04450 [archaeon]|jgi:hypothetical protein|nr:hypothetical protein [archaeon]
MIDIERREKIKKGLLGTVAIGAGLFAVNGINAKPLLGVGQETPTHIKRSLKKRRKIAKLSLKKRRELRMKLNAVSKENKGLKRAINVIHAERKRDKKAYLRKEKTRLGHLPGKE